MVHAKKTRLIARQLSQFITESLGIVAEIQDGDWERALIFLNIIQYNALQMQASDVLTRQSSDNLVADEVKRPITSTALARGLSLPRETVRRHFVHLTRQGALVRVGHNGFVVPVKYLGTAQVQNVLRRTTDCFYDLLSRLNMIGYDYDSDFIANLKKHRIESPHDLIIERLYIRLIVEICYAANASRMRSAHVILETVIVEYNTHQFDQETEDRYAGLDDIPPDTLRKPATIAWLCGKTGMTKSAVYRSLRKMASDGVVEKVGLGYIVPASRIRARIGQSLGGSVLFAACIRTLQAHIAEV